MHPTPAPPAGRPAPDEPDHVDDERITVAGLLFEVEAALARALDEDLRREADMPLGTFEVLIRLARSPERRLRHRELARQLSLTTGGITRMIDRVEAAGLVRRLRDPDDRRGSYAQLTPAGAAALAVATRTHLAGLQRHLVDPLGPEGLAALEAPLRRLRDTLCGDPADRRAGSG